MCFTYNGCLGYLGHYYTLFMGNMDRAAKIHFRNGSFISNRDVIDIVVYETPIAYKDGLWDGVFLNRISRLRVLTALPKLYRGTHTHLYVNA